jgi:hypothetical protein
MAQRSYRVCFVERTEDVLHRARDHDGKAAKALKRRHDDVASALAAAAKRGGGK